MWKKILLVNDDGIRSEGLRKLAEAASRFGRVWIVAPRHQCSGMSQKITIFDPIRIAPTDFTVPAEGAWCVEGTPADCVKIALSYLLPEKPDFVFSGINNGWNAGFDTAYSGTIGAAMEALMQGVPAMAFSTAFRDGFEAVDTYLPLLMEDLMAAPLPKNEIWNVNFPGGTVEECRGILTERTLAPMELYRDAYRREDLEDGAFTLQNDATVAGAEDAPEGTDVRAVLEGYISIGTLRCAVM